MNNNGYLKVVASMVMKQVEDRYTPPYTAIQIHLAYAQLTEPVSHLVDFFNVMRHLPGFKLSTESSDGNFKQVKQLSISQRFNPNCNSIRLDPTFIDREVT